MKIAEFFQKHNKNSFVGVLALIYTKLLAFSNKKRIKYLRDAGAKIGDNVYIGSINTLGSEPFLVEIGDNVYFSGTDTSIITHDGGVPYTFYMGLSSKQYDCFGKVKIGNNVFVGLRVIILKNVTIGDNCVIGAGSVVTKDIPSGSVACGVPARVIGTVEDYFLKNSDNLSDTIGWSTYKKRQFLNKKQD